MNSLSTVEAVLKTKNQLVRGDANGKNSLMGNGDVFIMSPTVAEMAKQDAKVKFNEQVEEARAEWNAKIDEHERHAKMMDEKMKENEEEFFLLQSLKELTPLIRLIIKELAGMIRNDERRQLFLYTVLQGNIKDFSVRKHMKYRQAQKAFEGLVQEIKSQAGFLRTYKEENIRLRATVRMYEMKSRQNGFDNDMLMREAEETNPEIFIPEDIKAAKALLDTPITELKFDIRSQRIISEADIKTLRELLQITSQYGFRKLRDMLRNFGLVSQKKVEKRLKELNVLDVAGNCNLYRYLDE